MCLIGLAWQAHPRWRLLLLGNRDELHARPTQGLASWPDAPQVLAGRDTEAGGTWMGVTRDGRAGVVTNVRDPAADTTGRSRGHLVADYLRGSATATDYARALRPRAPDYRPFNVLLLDAGHGVYMGNHPQSHGQPIAPGIHGLSNADFNTPWPKTRQLVNHLSAWRDAGGDTDFEPLFAALADASPWPDDVLPDTGIGIELERDLSAAFIRGQRYGTRASTLIAIDHAGHGCITERRFGASGVALGTNSLPF